MIGIHVLVIFLSVFWRVSICFQVPFYFSGWISLVSRIYLGHLLGRRGWNPGWCGRSRKWFQGSLFWFVSYLFRFLCRFFGSVLDSKQTFDRLFTAFWGICFRSWRISGSRSIDPTIGSRIWTKTVALIIMVNFITVRVVWRSWISLTVN